SAGDHHGCVGHTRRRQHVAWHVNATRLLRAGKHLFVNGDERGELRHQLELKTELHDFFAQFGLRDGKADHERILRHEIVDLPPRPESREDAMTILRLREFNWNLAYEILTGNFAAQHDHAAATMRITAGKNERLRTKQ